MFARVTPHVGTRRRAGNRLLAAVWCVFVLWLVLCAIMGAQHFNPHIRVLVAARVLNVCAATAVCAQESGRRVLWRPGQRTRACARRVLWVAWIYLFLCVCVHLSLIHI